MVTKDIAFETDRFRATKWSIEPGGEIPMHAHEHDYVVVSVSGGSMHVITAGGQETEYELEPGLSFARTTGAEHRNENRSGETVEFVEIEWIGPRPEGRRAAR